MQTRTLAIAKPAWKSPHAEGGAEYVAEGCPIHAVDLIGMWADAGAPETDAFDYVSVDYDQYSPPA